MSNQEDVLGWGSTTWRMTEAEILQFLHPEAKPLLPPVEYRNPTRYSTVGIPEKDIGGRSCAIYFFFGNTTGLNEVIIKPNEINPYSYYEDLLELLIQKYGAATKNEKINNTDTSVWQFPSTVVELQKIDAFALDMLLVSIAYRPYVKPDLSFL
jgi:hypothetical protein